MVFPSKIPNLSDLFVLEDTYKKKHNRMAKDDGTILSYS